MDGPLGVDIALDEDLVLLPSGDLQLRSGLDNYIQALRLRLGTEKGELWCHPEYGVRVRRFIRAPAAPVHQMDLEAELIDAIEADPRTVPGSARIEILQWDAKGIIVAVSAQPIGEPHPVNLVIGFGLDEITVEAVARP